MKKRIVMPRNAVMAAAGAHVSWLSMPCITAMTASPSRMIMNRPSRSGRCALSGGRATVCGTANHGVKKSMIAATAHTA